ncbi:AraC family transcriptional regulator [Deltaproteobacteria bacterium Smac51]|nr:AraC family transcriptional regulator [Deltaproteobacteria bacterium Smac51]
MMESNRVDAEKSWLLLRDGIWRNTLTGPGTHETGIKGFAFHRQVSNQDPKPHFFQPVIIVVAQGKKMIRIGDEEFKYGENICFVAGVDMPVTSCVMEASEEKPYLSMSLYLDTGLIAGLASKVPPSTGIGGGLTMGAMIQEVEPDLLDAFLRLLELAERPKQIPVMKELLIQEIHYRLLASPFGHVLRSLNTFGSQGYQIAQAISWLKENYTEPLLVEQLADRSNMAPSTFHRYFKEVTTLSPLQYQKRLRLGEAQRLMLSGDHDVTQAALAVGYESPTQFIREYKRLFGEPPRRNIKHIRNMPHDYEQSLASA